jgi:arylsulfatase A-like enzyme
VQDESWHYEYLVPGQHIPKAGLNWPEGFPLNGIANVREGKKPPGNYKEFDWGPFDKPDAEMGDGQMVAWAADYLAARHDKPFFLAAGIFRPHLTWYAPRKYFDLYPLDDIVLPEVNENDLNDVPPLGRTFAEGARADFELVKASGQYRHAVQAYLACISFADALVGRLLDALDASPHADNTVVMLWSDHGWHLGEKGAWHKRTLWERATRVPLSIAAPGTSQSGKTCTRPVNLIDLCPTLVDLCGLSQVSNLDGTSLVPLLRNPDAPWESPSLTTLERGNHTLRSERWRYIRYADGTEELYDCVADPNEWNNLAGGPAHAAVKAEFTQWLPASDAPNAPPKAAFEFDPETYTWTRK